MWTRARAIVTDYGARLARSDVPKLYIKAEPGLLQPSQHAFCRAWPAQREISVRGLHTPQEDSPDEIGQALRNWMQSLPSET